LSSNRPVLPLDVAHALQARHDELLRALSEPPRAALVARLWAAGRQLAEAGVRAKSGRETCGMTPLDVALEW
jgi:hypothetical protein